MTFLLEVTWLVNGVHLYLCQAQNKSVFCEGLRALLENFGKQATSQKLRNTADRGRCTGLKTVRL